MACLCQELKLSASDYVIHHELFEKGFLNKEGHSERAANALKARNTFKLSS